MRFRPEIGNEDTKYLNESVQRQCELLVKSVSGNWMGPDLAKIIFDYCGHW